MKKFALGAIRFVVTLAQFVRECYKEFQFRIAFEIEYRALQLHVYLLKRHTERLVRKTAAMRAMIAAYK